MSQYKIQVGSWTKLPNGKVQEDTRDIMEMMGRAVSIIPEIFVSRVGRNWEYVGVRGVEICVYDSDTYNEPSLFIPYEELQKMSNKPETKVTSLLNTKLDCRKPDGSVDEELSRAFQEACFGQGILWCGQYKDIRYLSSPFLFAEPDGCLGYTNIESEKFFNEFVSCKQINFKYYRTLTWEATEVEPDIIAEDKMVDICGVEYSAKELSEALALIKSARK